MVAFRVESAALWEKLFKVFTREREGWKNLLFEKLAELGGAF